MIQANELRIGNIVFYEGKATSIDWNILGMVQTPYEPIEITAEILENAHFLDGEKEFQANIMSIVDGKMLLYTFEDKVTLFEFPCQYVHQLQNLYFAMTGEELEIAL